MKKYLALFTTIALVIYLLFGSLHVNAIPPGDAYLETEEFLYNMQQDLIPKLGSSDRRRMMAAERAWIKFRDAEVNFYSRYYVNSKGGLSLKIKLTEERAGYLQSILKQLPQRKGKDIGPIRTWEIPFWKFVDSPAHEFLKRSQSDRKAASIVIEECYGKCQNTDR